MHNLVVLATADSEDPDYMQHNASGIIPHVTRVSTQVMLHEGMVTLPCFLFVLSPLNALNKDSTRSFSRLWMSVTTQSGSGRQYLDLDDNMLQVPDEIKSSVVNVSCVWET